MNADQLPKLSATDAEKYQIIQSRILEGQLLHSTQKTSQYQLDTVTKECIGWSKHNENLLSRLFDNTEISDKYDKFSDDIYRTPYDPEPTTSEKFDIYQKRFENSINSLVKICEQIEIPEEPLEIPPRVFGEEIFIVHGHDEAAKHKIARFIENLDLTATILDEKPSKGQTIFDKFGEHADEAGFAIVLLTGDDVGAPKEKLDNSEPRARQNVILELGYFLHGLGRERVCVLHEEGVELPSDIHGIVYVSLDSADGWKLKLCKELQSVGYSFDMSKVL